MDRRWRILLTSGVVAAMVAPVALDADGYPLSIYPMYASARDAEVTLATAQALDADGRSASLGPQTIGRSDDALIVAGELREAIADGRADERCAEIADRVARRADDDSRGAVAVEVVTERHDVVARASGEDSLRERTVHARCEVAR